MRPIRRGARYAAWPAAFALAVPLNLLAAPAHAQPSLCVVNGQPGTATGTAEDDNITCAGAITFRVTGGGGNDNINVTAVAAEGRVEGGDGDDNVNVAAVAADGRVEGGNGDDNINTTGNFGTVDGGPGRDRCVTAPPNPPKNCEP